MDLDAIKVSTSRRSPRPIACCSYGRPCRRSCRRSRSWPRGGSGTNSHRLARCWARRIALARAMEAHHHEILLIGTRGEIPAPAQGTQCRASSPRRSASTQQAREFDAMIEASPDLAEDRAVRPRQGEAGMGHVGERGGAAMTFRIVDGWSGRGRGSARAHEELPAHDPERMKGQSKPCWTPFPISTIIVSRTGVGPWTLGLGYEASVSANTRRISGTTRSTRTCCRG